MREGEIAGICLIAGVVGLLISGDINVLAGVLAGIVTGLIPGLHINLFLPFISGSAFVVGLAVAHSFFDFVPAILLGAPDEAAALSVLPSHKMLLRGKALEAFRLTIVGGLFAGIIAIATVPLLGFVKEIYWIVPFALIVSLFFLIKSTKRKAERILVMIASAMLGFAAFEVSYGLPAILSGFFGVATILYSIRGRKSIPPQLPTAETQITTREAGLGAAAGLFAGLFPAISSSVAATTVCPKMRHKEFLSVLGGTNTVYAFMAILAIHLIGRPRSGAAIAIANEQHSLLFLIGVSLTALAFSAWIAWTLSKTIVTSFNKINYRLASFVALIVVIVLNAINGWTSILLMLAATIVGYACLVSGARRSSCMASLIIPVLLFYLT